MVSALKKEAAGRSTLMPSVQLDLGKFVVLRGPRADGTYRVLFELPPRLRPSGWLPTTPLPIEGVRRGDLTDADEVARIQRDAAKLYAAYVQARLGKKPPEGRTLRRLVGLWQASQRFKATKPRTKKGYDYIAKDILAWADTQRKQPDPTHMTANDVERFLALWDDRPTQKFHVRKVLRLVMAEAVKEGWRTDNPVASVTVSMPQSSVEIWEQEDVDAYVWASVAAGQPWVAAAILTEWEIGQRLTDLILFRRGADYSPEDGAFRFWQSKTASWLTIPVSGRLRAVLEACKVEGSPYLFLDGGTGRPFRDVDRLSHVFEEIRSRVKGRRHLVFRALRHSCVVQLARAVCTVPEIASITGHSISSVEKILSVYLPRDNKVAWNAQRKRGLIGG